jgi:hypothetical protein
MENTAPPTDNCPNRHFQQLSGRHVDPSQSAAWKRGDVMKTAVIRAVRSSAGFLSILLAACPVLAQAAAHLEKPPRQSDADARIASLDKSLQETRAELSETRAEIRQLRSILEAINKKMATSSPPAAQVAESRVSRQSPSAPESSSEEAAAPAAQISEDDWQVVRAEVQQQAQEKVESGSKYRLKLWGLALFNAFDVSGRVDNLDVPTLAVPGPSGSAPGSLGGSARQSIFGLTGTGPDLFGAQTSADLEMDFFGGLPGSYGGGSSGIVRLRLARIRFDWDRTSVTGGLDSPFFSPNVPTSYMSVAEPGFAASGNLWAWSPTVRVERRFDVPGAELKIQAGVLAPATYGSAASGRREPTPGESSRQPVYALRFSTNGTHGDRPAAVGISGLYFPQRFPGGANVSGWGGLFDWRFPLFPHAELSGELFGGRGLDSFGGVPVPLIPAGDYNQYIQVGAPALAEIPMIGGWSQLKIAIDERSEFNIAVGSGGRISNELAQVAPLSPLLEYLSPRNETLFVNYIFRPRSDLLFAPEYRRLRTYPINGPAARATQIGVAAGFLF